MAITSQDIRFTVLFDDSPNIKITDNIQSAYNTIHGLTLADVNIRLKIEFGSDVIWDGISDLTEDITLSSSWYKNIGTSQGLKLNILGVPVHGLYKFTYSVYNTAANVDAPPLASVVQYHNYGYVRPTANLAIDYSCGSSKQSPYIRSKDNTIYMIEYNGQSVYGSPVYTSHKFNYPISSGQTNINQSPATSEILHGNLFTLLNTSSIASNCTFTIQNADSTNNMTVTYKCYINAETSENVSCDECTCLYWYCFNNIYDKYYEMLGVNPTLAIKYKSMLTDVSINYAYYHQALNCGEDATKFCNKLKELATLENCTCLPAQTTSVRISPVGGNSSLSYVTGGQVDGNGDLILTYNDATTTNAGHVTGADGNDGVDGVDGAAGTAGVAGAAGVDGVATVRTYYNSYNMSIPADIWTTIRTETFTTNLLSSDGDGIKIKASITNFGGFAIPENVKYRILINGTSVGETDFMDSNNMTINNENIVVYYNGFTVIRVFSDYTYNTLSGTLSGSSNSSITYANTVVEIQAYRDTIGTLNTSPQEVGVDSLAIIKYKGGII